MKALLATLAIMGSIANAPAFAEAGAAPTGTTSALWHLPSAATAMRITGEAGYVGWPVYVPAAAAASYKTFQLGYQASIAVMPEASWITLTINGQSIGRIPVAAPIAVKTMRFDIPPGVLQPGWNAVGIDVAQRHRVDCSIASTYELWTQIDPAQTGFVGAPPVMTSAADLPALPVDQDGATRFHLMLPKDPSPDDLGRAVRVVERVALRGRFAHPVVDSVSSPTGLHVAVGTPAFLATVAGAVGKTAKPPQWSTTPGGAPLLTVSGSTDAEVDQAIVAFGDAGGGPVGTEEGLKAFGRANGMRLRPGGSLTLADLGIATRAFTGRLLRQAFDVILPPDAYPADYGEARLSLDGGYAAGLTRDARIVVRVNGVIDGNLDFDRAGGSVLQGQIIHMPLDAFRPGRNRIEIEAQLPAKSDEACDTLSSIGAKERILLLGTSTLSMPPLARVAQFPSLSATLAGNLRITPGTPPRVFLPHATEGAVSAAATLLTNASLATGVPTGAVFQRGTPQSGSEPAVVVGNSSDMPTQVLASAGLDTESVAATWRAGPRPVTPGGETVRSNGGGSDVARLDAWGDHVDDGRSWLGGSDSLLNSVGGKFLQSLRSAGLVAYPQRTLDVTADTSFVFAQGFLEDTPLTLVTARDDKALSSGMAALTEPARLSSLDGRAASIESNAAGTNLVPARDAAFFRTQSFSFINDRLIVAGWVSKHASWYLAAVLLGTIMLGLTTWSFLTFGRQGGRT